MSVFSAIGDLFGYEDPSKEAGKYMEQIPGTIKPYYEPYSEMGQRLAPQLEGEFGQLATDPGAMLDKIGAGYKQSPGYQFQLQQALRGAGNAAAAGGYTGSPQAQNYAARISQGLAAQDYGNYMQRALREQGMGLQGQMGLEQQGYGAGADLAQSLANYLTGRGKLAYEGAASQNQMISNLLGGLGKAGIGYLSGGWSGAADMFNPQQRSRTNTGITGIF